MKKSKFTESQIIKILKETEGGRNAAEVCREYGISQATFYNWRKKYGGMDVQQLKQHLSHTLQDTAHISDH